MKQRSVISVLLLSIVTFGIYGLVWLVKTKEEMVSLGADIPTAWLLIIPFVNIWWMWKYSEGVAKVSDGKMSGVLTFIILYFLNVIGYMIIQSTFNSIPEKNNNSDNQATSPVADTQNPTSTTPPVA